MNELPIQGEEVVLPGAGGRPEDPDVRAIRYRIVQIDAVPHMGPSSWQGMERCTCRHSMESQCGGAEAEGSR